MVSYHSMINQCLFSSNHAITVTQIVMQSVLFLGQSGLLCFLFRFMYTDFSNFDRGQGQ